MNTYTIERTVLIEHLDDLNHVNNVYYLSWVQDAAKAHWKSLIANQNFEFHAWVVRSHYIEYKKAAQLGDIIIITTYVKNSKAYLSERIVEVSLKKSGQLLARCTTQWCYINKSSGKKELIPKHIIDLLA
ncbi:MAG: thioesterase [Flavobacteriaceae bacterium]|nr:thioesterase [Flavobacteriaceae bacterium]